MTDLPERLHARFLAKIDMRGTDECWPWTGAISDAGYGKYIDDKRRKWFRSHRVAYELLVGLIPEGLTLDHLCRNRACCNPAHLEPVTMVENSRRGFSPPAINGRKTHCKHGHPFTPENTLVSRDGRHRRCRQCYRRQNTEYRERKRAAA